MSFDPVSYIMGKQAGGGGGSTLQEKTVPTVTQNGDVVVNPDSGYDGMSKVTVPVNVVAPDPYALTITEHENAVPESAYRCGCYGGGTFVAFGGLSGTSKAIYSDDGVIWAEPQTQINKTPTFCAYGNNIFLGVLSTGEGFVSSDRGRTWTSVTVPKYAGESGGLVGLVFNGTNFILGVYDEDSSGTNFYQSSDGSIWTLVETTTDITVTASFPSGLCYDGEYYYAKNDSDGVSKSSDLWAFDEVNYDALVYSGAGIKLKPIADTFYADNDIPLLVGGSFQAFYNSAGNVSCRAIMSTNSINFRESTSQIQYAIRANSKGYLSCTKGSSANPIQFCYKPMDREPKTLQTTIAVSAAGNPLILANENKLIVLVSRKTSVWEVIQP